MPTDLTPDQWAALPGLVEAAEKMPPNFMAFPGPEGVAAVRADEELRALAPSLARAALAERARAVAAEAVTHADRVEAIRALAREHGREEVMERQWRLLAEESVHDHLETEAELEKALADLAALRAERERLREAVLAVLDGDGGFVVAEPWDRETREWSKHDRCTHGRWRYEDCPSCLDAAIRAALAADAPEGTA